MQILHELVVADTGPHKPKQILHQMEYLDPEKIINLTVYLPDKIIYLKPLIFHQ